MTITAPPPAGRGLLAGRGRLLGSAGTDRDGAVDGAGAADRVGVVDALGPVEVALSDVTSPEFFRAHYARLAGWTRGLVDDDDTAHEIASEAFTRLVAKRRRLDDPRGYLYTIAVNLVRDHWRRTQRERRRLREIIAGRPSEVLGSPSGASELRMVVEQLPDKLRAPVLLHYYADLSVADVARHLGRKPGTVKSDLFDARALLRRALTEDPR